MSEQSSSAAPRPASSGAEGDPRPSGTSAGRNRLALAVAIATFLLANAGLAIALISWREPAFGWLGAEPGWALVAWLIGIGAAGSLLEFLLLALAILAYRLIAGTEA